MYKYLLDKEKNLFYPLIDDKSIVNVNTINDVQIEELFNPMVEDILILDEYRFAVGQYPSASIGVECIPERAGRLAYLDVTTSNPDCCEVLYIDDSNTIGLNPVRRGESTITITEANSGISKEARVFIQSVPRLRASGLGPLYISSSILQESFDEAVYRVEVYSHSSSDLFSYWSDGSTENPREITIYEDTYLTAYYKPILCKIEVRSSNNDWGTVRGGGSVRYGSNFMIKAIPNSGYRFVLWSDGDQNPERTMWASGDVVYEAIFEELNPNLVIYYTSKDGQVVWPNAYSFGANLVENTYTNGQGMMVFDSDVTIIGNSAFSSRPSLTSITIPNSVTSIDGYAFYGCPSLTSVTIPESVTSIRYNAFERCTSLTSITIPNSVTNIENDAFLTCTSLTSVTIPESVTSIGNRAFGYCYSLASVTINSDAIVNKQYSQDSNLSHIFGQQVTEYVIGDNVIGIGNYAFYDCTSLTSIVIGNGVTTIEPWAFYGCSSLTSITIPDSVTSFGQGAFEDCSSLASITIPNSVTSIGDGAFLYCASLTSVVIPDSVTSIERLAFSHCTSLASITIGKSIASIGDYTFYDCSSLASITCKAITPPVLGSYNRLPSVTAVYVPVGTTGAYKMATNWSYYSTIIQPISS